MFDRLNRNPSRAVCADTRNCARFIHDRRGVAGIEFGLIALPFLLMVVAILEYGYGNFAQSRLDAVVAQTSRQIMTGYVQNQSVAGKPLTAQQFRDQIICPKLPTMLSCSDVYVDVAAFDAPPTGYVGASPYEAYVNPAKNGLIPPKLNTSNSYCVGDKGKYVVLRVAYPAPILTTAAIYPNVITYKGRKSRLLTSTTTFKNEPFPNSNAKC